MSKTPSVRILKDQLKDTDAYVTKTCIPIVMHMKRLCVSAHV